MKKTQPKQTAATQPAAAPEGVNDTPPDHRYSVDMYENGDHSTDGVELSRAEYIALKQYVAGLRGIVPATTPAEPPAESITAPQPKLDPMKIPRGPLSPEQEQEAGAALLSRLQGQMANMSTCELQSLAWYVDIEDADCGCDTPAEDFITTLVLHHTVRPLTPDDATRKLEEFRENFDGMVRAARAFTARYPEAVKTATAA